MKSKRFVKLEQLTPEDQAARARLFFGDPRPRISSAFKKRADADLARLAFWALEMDELPF